MALKHLSILLFLIVLAACGHSTPDDFKEEAQGITRTITENLRQIHSRDELLAAAPKLKKLFNELTDIMIASHEFQHKHPGAEKPSLTVDDRVQSDALREQLNRIYQMGGAKEIVEKCQEEALHRLDAYLNKP